MLERALIVGLGSIGRRHLMNLRGLAPDVDVTVLHGRPRADREDIPGIHRVYSLDAALERGPQVAIIASPAPMHVPAAITLANEGVHLLIEKPLSDTLDGVDQLAGAVASARIVAQVGYNFRFYPPLQIFRQAVVDGRIGQLVSIRAECGQHLSMWRTAHANPDTITGKASLGGDVMLELSHEFDCVSWIAGPVERVSAETGTLSGQPIDVDDIADVLLRFESGAIGSVHVDMIQQPATRTCKAVGTAGTITWDWSTNAVRLFSSSAGSWQELHPASTIDKNDMYVDELRGFIGSVAEGTPPTVGIADGVRALQIALTARQSARCGRSIRL